MKSLRIVIVGTLASNPYAGMAWMHLQIVAGLRRLGHDAYYFETTSTWPYDPIRQMKVCRTFRRNLKNLRNNRPINREGIHQERVILRRSTIRNHLREAGVDDTIFYIGKSFQ